jgi:tRNA uridine 5-carboxymethylaminomethyl modification enzyme
LRLTERGHAIGLASEARVTAVREKKTAIEVLTGLIRQTKVTPEQVNPWLTEKGSAAIHEKTGLYNLLKRPEISLSDVEQINQFADFPVASTEVLEQVLIEIKYEDYLSRERVNAQKLTHWENLSINPDFDYSQLSALSFEGREKLKKQRPATIGQATRISGVSPSDVSILLVYLGR